MFASLATRATNTTRPFGTKSAAPPARAAMSEILGTAQLLEAGKKDVGDMPSTALPPENDKIARYLDALNAKAADHNPTLAQVAKVVKPAILLLVRLGVCLVPIYTWAIKWCVFLYGYLPTNVIVAIFGAVRTRPPPVPSAVPRPSALGPRPGASGARPSARSRRRSASSAARTSRRSRRSRPFARCARLGSPAAGDDELCRRRDANHAAARRRPDQPPGRRAVAAELRPGIRLGALQPGGAVPRARAAAGRRARASGRRDDRAHQVSEPRR